MPPYYKKISDKFGGDFQLQWHHSIARNADFISIVRRAIHTLGTL
jgi:hypothetical protein